MRIAIDSFRGEAPRLTPRALPPNAAQQAINARLMTGDLEAWRQFAAEQSLANDTGIVQTIYKLNGAWLSWTADVDVARGAVAGDTTFRTFLTGPDVYDRPQFTNYEMATDGAEPFPAVTRPLGVPGPEGSPVVTPGVDPNPSSFNVDVFDDGGQLATNWTYAPFQDSHGGVTQVYETGDRYEMLYDDNPGAPAYMFRNFGVATCNVMRFSFDFEMTSGSNNYLSMNAGVMRTQAGAGIAIGVAPGVFGIGAASGWSIIGQVGYSVVAAAVTFDTIYTCQVQVISNADGTSTVTAELFQGSAQLATVTVTNNFTKGDFCGFYEETSNNDGLDRYRTLVGNILALGSGATGYVANNTATTYVYTFKNDLGQESAPSFASSTVLRPDGVSITVTTPTDVPTGIGSEWVIETKAIYRAVTGATGTAYRFVAEIPLAQADYVDSTPDSELGEVLQSEIWALPPVDLRGILALPNGVTAGFSKNQLCFSAQNYPHAWPVEYRLTVDTDIVAIGNIDTTVVIGTKNFIYLAIGTDPASYSMTKLEVPQACVAKRSLAYLIGIGVVFASPDGLIAVAGNGNVRNLTDTVFTRDQWQALNPESIIGVAHDDVYHMFYDNDVVPDFCDLAPAEERDFAGYTFADNFTGDSFTALTDHVPDEHPLGVGWLHVSGGQANLLEGSLVCGDPVFYQESISNTDVMPAPGIGGVLTLTATFAYFGPTDTIGDNVIELSWGSSSGGFARLVATRTASGMTIEAYTEDEGPSEVLTVADLPDCQWHQAIFQVDNETGEMTLFVDDLEPQVGSGSAYGNPPAPRVRVELTQSDFNAMRMADMGVRTAEI